MQHLRHPAPACRASGREAGGGVAVRGPAVGHEPVPEPPTPQSTALYWWFPGSALDVSLSRRWLAAAVEQAWGAGDDADRVVLAYSEVATNAVVHGRGPVTVAARIRAGGVTCQVADCSAGTPQIRHADPDDVCGRGLDLVEMMVDRFRVDLDEVGKTVSFEVGRHQGTTGTTGTTGATAGSARSPLRQSGPGLVVGPAKASLQKEPGSGPGPGSGFDESSVGGSAGGSADGNPPGSRSGSPGASPVAPGGRG